MIRNGTTTFIDIFRHPDAAAEVAVASGLRATISPQLIDDPEEGPGETLASSEAFVDTWRGRHPRVRPWFGPHSLYTVRESTYRRIRELSRHYRVGIHTHLAESAVETTIVAERTGGLTPAAFLDRLIGLGRDVVVAHCVHLDDDDLALVADRRVGVAHCPTSNMKLGNGMARIPELLAAGATVGLGTDSPMTNNDLDPFEEMRQAGLTAKLSRGDPSVLTSRELLRLATIGSATVLGLDDLVGSIEIGKRADLVVVDLDHPRAWPLFREHGANVVEQLVWACCGADVRFTVCDGVVLLDDRRLTTLDLGEIAEVVDTEARHLLAAAGVLDAVLHRHHPDNTEKR
jgi:5-methylthioadenosine/S-adenosylhomocysteine deaminase